MDAMQIAKQRAETAGAKNVVIPTGGTGSAAKRALDYFGPDYTVYAVGNPDTSRERYCLHRGITEEKRQELEQLGIKVALQDYSIFQGRRLHVGEKVFDFSDCEGQRNALLDAVIENIGQGKTETIMDIIRHTFSWFGEAGQICLEVVLMGADSGVLPLRELCTAIASPVDLGASDACIVLHPATTAKLFTWDFHLIAFDQVGKYTPLIVSDLGTSLHFYSDLVGLKRLTGDDRAGFVELALGAGKLALAEEAAIPAVSRETSIPMDTLRGETRRLLFAVPNVEGACERLAAEGVRTEPGDQEWITRFKDPDGNTVEIMP